MMNNRDPKMSSHSPDAFCAVPDASIVGYYWRDYTGVIPEDALSGGKDKNCQNIYIGQALCRSYLGVAQINKGKSEIKVPMSGARTVTKGIKILCTQNPTHFKWMVISGTKLSLELIGKHAVIGGLEADMVLHVGRISRECSIIIGKILSWDEGIMYYVFDDREMEVKDYEILIYDQK